MQPGDLERPIIGIPAGQWATAENVVRQGIPREYVRALEAAGAVPVIIPVPEQPQLAFSYLKGLDGLLLAGGGDVDPARFGEEPLPQLRKVDPERDAMEIALTEKALEMDLPVLGICRGIQVLNVAAGGTLYQDLPSQVPHVLQHDQNAPRWYPCHEVRLEPDSMVAGILQTDTLRVNSFHHQAVRVVAPPFRVAAKAKDSVIESIESRDHTFVIGVQWHPECMVERYPVQRLIFGAFAKAARARRASREHRAPAATATRG
ncbi:MAG: gamma-glutamyl-gamma-aminobutyrate hydrolase family protein [Bacillota bacterium]